MSEEFYAPGILDIASKGHPSRNYEVRWQAKRNTAPLLTHVITDGVDRFDLRVCYYLYFAGSEVVYLSSEMQSLASETALFLLFLDSSGRHSALPVYA